MCVCLGDCNNVMESLVWVYVCVCVRACVYVYVCTYLPPCAGKYVCIMFVCVCMCVRALTTCADIHKLVTGNDLIISLMGTQPADWQHTQALTVQFPR